MYLHLHLLVQISGGNWSKQALWLVLFLLDNSFGLQLVYADLDGGLGFCFGRHIGL